MEQLVARLAEVESKQPGPLPGATVTHGASGGKGKRIEVTMIDMNQQQERELMRQSVITKKSGGDVTTLAGNSQAFMLTSSPMRAFNAKAASSKRRSPVDSKYAANATDKQESAPEPNGEDEEI